MNTARTNVTEIRQFSRERKQSAGANGQPLDDCREISVLKLAQAMAESLPPIIARLLTLAEKSMGLEMYHLYMDTMELARDHGAELVADFRTQYLQGFNRACRHEARLDHDPAHPHLSLMEPDDLEQSLAEETLANAIFNACSEELFGLDKRMGLLINDPDLSLGESPLGPEVIGAALMHALARREASIKVRLLLVSQLNKHLPARVRDIYREINERLIKRGVLPTIRVGLRRSGGGAGPAATAGGSEAGQGDIFDTLRRLMSGGATPAPAAPTIVAPSMPGGTMAAAVPGGVGGGQASAFMQALNRLQRGQFDTEVLHDLDPASFVSGQVNVLHGLRHSGVANVMGPMDTMTLDIVAMVFDYVLDDNRIPDAIKALIGRLQIPVLKVAMLDKSFFSHKQHPARQLLDTLATAAIGWDASEGHDSGLYRKVDELVQGILNRFDDKLDVFAEALADLEHYLAEEARAASRQVGRSARIIRQQEEIDLARIIAHEEVQSRVLGQALPEVIRAFLADYWEKRLASLHARREGDDSSWNAAIDTMSDLIWSVSPKFDPDDRKRLVEKLPSLLKRLDTGLTELGVADAERDLFFTRLVHCHAQAIKASLADEEPGAADPFVDPAVIGDVPVLDEPVDFKPVAVPDVEEASAQEAVADLPLLDLPPAAVGSEAPLLKRGSWIEFTQDDGVLVRAKLTWVSPRRGIYLFTNRHGQRAISIGANGLAAKLQSGEVRIIDDVPLLDRAVNRLMERLGQGGH